MHPLSLYRVCISGNFDYQKVLYYRLYSYQSPSRLGDSFNVVNGFHEELIRNNDLRDPNGAKKMRPFSGARLLKGAAFVWA